MSLLAQKDKVVLIAINERGIFVIDHAESTLLLGLRYEEFSWDFAKPNNPDDPECLPCIFLEVITEIFLLYTIPNINLIFLV